MNTEDACSASDHVIEHDLVRSLKVTRVECLIRELGIYMASLVVVLLNVY